MQDYFYLAQPFTAGWAFETIISSLAPLGAKAHISSFDRNPQA
jgi:hypothetical protein